MIKTVLLGSILLIQLLCINSLYINMQGKDRQCLQVEMRENQKLNYTYVVSGKNEDKFRLSIFEGNPSTTIKVRSLQDIFNQKEHSDQFIAPKESRFYFCFSSIDNSPKVLEFDFDREDETDYAQNRSLNQIESNMVDIHKRFQQIYRNIRFQATRDSTHAKMIESTESRVKWCSLVQMVSLIIICSIQIYIVTRFFRENQSLLTV